MQIQLAQIIFQIINFGVVLGALTFLMYKPILKTLQNRAKKIEEGQKAAEAVLKEKEAIETLKQEAATTAKKDAAAMLAEAKSQVEEKKKALMAEARAEVKSYLSKEKDKWEAEKATLITQMENEFTTGVFQVVEKVLGGGVIDQKTHGKLIEQSIKEITQTL